MKKKKAFFIITLILVSIVIAVFIVYAKNIKNKKQETIAIAETTRRTKNNVE